MQSWPWSFLPTERRFYLIADALERRWGPSRQDLKAMCDSAFGVLLFTRQQAEVIRADVARRNARADESANLASTF